MSENNSKMQPHSPFVSERDILDNGFSKGWGFHFPPSEEYWLDCHNHLSSGKTHSELYRILDDWFARVDGFRLGKVMAIAEGSDAFNVYKDVSSQDKRFSWLIHIPYNNPDVELLQNAIDNGAVGLKLHNDSIMKGKEKPEVWLSDKWSRMFELVEKSGIPILWHVTQRVSYSPYHGGGYNSYWAEGQEKGVTYTNEDLLNICFKVVKTFPKLKLLAAHQMHIGLERLSALLDEHKNFYFDTSCGFVLRADDDFYEADREMLWDFFNQYQDRILFGSDSALAPGVLDEYVAQSFLTHTRFIHKLRLPYDTLQKVAYENAEKLFGLESTRIIRRGNLRP